MRLLTVNYAVPNPEIDNHTIFNAPPFFDYPAAVVDPAGISKAIEDVINGAEQQSAEGQPVRDELSSPAAVSLAEALRRRREETIRLLGRGGVVLVFAQPNILHPRVSGFTGCDRYFWLPAPEGIAYREGFLFGAGGGQVNVGHERHPIAGLLEKHARQIAYRVYFNEEAPGFGEWATVLARSSGGAAVSIEIRVLGGRVIFLPAIEALRPGQARFELAKDLLDAASRLVLASGAAAAPHWVEGYALPGIEPGRRALEKAGLAATEALSVRDAATATLEELERYRALLWQEGFQLEEAARAAMRLFGFSLTGEPGDPAVIMADGVAAVLESEGAQGAVGDEAFRRLSRKIEDDLLHDGEGKKGILVVNGHRLEDPSERAPGYEERLLRAAEFQGFALVPAPALFRMVELVLAGRVERAPVRQILLETEGEAGIPGDMMIFEKEEIPEERGAVDAI